MPSPGKDAKRVRLAALDRDELTLGPESIHIDVTNGCNTNCITCWDHSPLLTIGRSSAWKRKRIDANAVATLLDDVATLGGLRAVVVSGMGEPFTHPDIWDILEAVKSRGLHLTIITNLVAADAARIVALDVDELLIGIHGATLASYLAFHPNFSAEQWHGLHAMLARFAESGRRYKHVHVVCEPNADELDRMVLQAHRYGAKQINFKLASLKAGTEACAITAVQRARLVDDLVPRACTLAAELGIATNLDVFAKQLDASGHDTAPIDEIGCFMGHFYARVLVDGTVLYCCSTDVRIGSLADGSRFSDLWRGHTWAAWRARMRRGDYLPSCRQCGKVAQNVALAAQFEALYGRDRMLAVTGRASAGDSPPRAPLAEASR